jgi:hypothetical protein
MESRRGDRRALLQDALNTVAVKVGEFAGGHAVRLRDAFSPSENRLPRHRQFGGDLAGSHPGALKPAIIAENASSLTCCFGIAASGWRGGDYRRQKLRR